MMRPTMIEGPTGESHQCNSLLPSFFFFFLISLFSITREISLFSCESYVFIGKNIINKELFCQLVLGL